MTIATTFVYMYCKLYIALSGVQAQIVYNMNTTEIIMSNSEAYGFDDRVYKDMDSVYNTQYYIQAGLFLSLPLICVYFAEMGLRRGLVQFLEMVFTAGPMFFIFQLGTTMHFFDNNLLHGEAQYKATGRGFKITRETFVLLYKAYALSHYRKAIELIGLCLVYLAFGKFDICDISVAVSPYIFNTDGLDWEKTKADVSAWAKWMYAAEDYQDEDTVMEGVSEELRMIRDEESGSDDSSANGGTSFVKFLVGLFLVLVSSIFLGCVNMYLSDSFRGIDDTTYMFVNCTSLQFLGALFSFFFMDRIDHKRMLYCTLLPIAALVCILGVNNKSVFVTGDSEYLMLQIVGLLLYFFAGLGITSVPWVSCIGLFTTKKRAMYVTVYFMVFFLLPVCATFIRSNESMAGNEYLYLFGLSGCCAVLMGLLFTMGTLKNGMLCTKGEMEAERTRLRRIRASRRSARTPGSARPRNFSRSRAKSHSNYQMYDSPAGSAM
ncbi:unnamed protein product [Peronospora belbahrii]|uniref:Glycosyl transferase 48 domain-containing protein n=1 Tax=Peronospora belbahrii TaxID=622444 RepID=A0ABN8CPM9_9STRA|nr:unnamed protein product [Peronospora belbahrii]